MMVTPLQDYKFLNKGWINKGYKASEATSRAACFALLEWFSWLTSLILPSDVLSE